MVVRNIQYSMEVSKTALTKTLELKVSVLAFFIV